MDELWIGHANGPDAAAQRILDDPGISAAAAVLLALTYGLRG